MDSSKHVENQKQKRHRDAISPDVSKAKAIATDWQVLHPWVVVLNPGMDCESVYKEFRTYDEANHFVHHPARFTESMDIVKRLPNGDLTTEY